MRYWTISRFRKIVTPLKLLHCEMNKNPSCLLLTITSKSLWKLSLTYYKIYLHYFFFFFVSRLVLFRLVSFRLIEWAAQSSARSSILETIEDRDTRRTFWGYWENDSIIALKTIAKDKALNTPTARRHIFISRKTRALVKLSFSVNDIEQSMRYIYIYVYKT